MHFPLPATTRLQQIERTLPGNLRVTARTADDEVMVVEDAAKRVFGVQFHPESIMTPDGAVIVANFLSLVPNGKAGANACPSEKAGANACSSGKVGAPC